ncbi:CPBP family intramembrane glutamic endopeptidase [Ideonella sp. BN130291]|uniref:CPBP family intramembrane glutamic endopeptidase n=1 Tax=Ideonella sp. BN130291 TaxID=3112940 RepID=UPI002E25903C|nr:CPBP family intramembrane glutamic endopeptidase [Ideonella sp. BN130291]
MPERASTTAATPAEAGAVVAICFGLFIVWSLSAAAAGFQTGTGFSDAVFTETIAIECFLGSTALWFLRGRGHSVRTLLPLPTWWGTLLGVALCFACLVGWGLVSPLFSVAEQAAQPISQIMAVSRPSLTMIVLASMVNGLYEETFLVGYLVRGFSGLGASLALGISLLVRLLYHVYQGPIGALSVVVFGLVVSLFYWRTRLLWPVVVAHALQDVIAFTYAQ